jgi:hypothetical protein
MGTSTISVTISAVMKRPNATTIGKNAFDRRRYKMTSTGSVDTIAAGMRRGMIGARLPIIVLPMARNVSGGNDAIDRLRPSHGPQNTPATKAERKMFTNCQILRVKTELSSERLRV